VSVTLTAFFLGTSLLELLRLGDTSSDSSYWNAERVMSVLASFVLQFIAYKEYREWRAEREEKRRMGMEELIVEGGGLEMKLAESPFEIGDGMEMEAEAEGEERMPPVKPTLSSSSVEFQELETASASDEGSSDGRGSDDEIEAKLADAGQSFRRLFVVCLMGTLDDMIVFSAFVAGAGGDGTAGGGLKFTLPSLFIGSTGAALVIVGVAWVFSGIAWFRRVIKKLPMWALLSGIGLYVLVVGLV
jgi:hypothetical protein